MENLKLDIMRINDVKWKDNQNFGSNDSRIMTAKANKVITDIVR